MNRILLMILNLFLFVSLGYSQESGEVLGQATALTNSLLGSSGLTSGFTMGSIIAGVIFGSVGFIAFMYGKKNSFFIPMFIGIALMVYPYFVRSTLWTYVVGVALSACLFIFRD